MSTLPYLCPEHPEAQVRHEWDRTRAEVNWGPSRPRNTISETDSNHRYFCNECDRELALEEEVSVLRDREGGEGE